MSFEKKKAKMTSTFNERHLKIDLINQMSWKKCKLTTAKMTKTIDWLSLPLALTPFIAQQNILDKEHIVFSQ